MNRKRALTAAAVARIKPPNTGQKDYSDAFVPGLTLRVSNSGTKSWTFVYRIDGRQRRITIGRYPAFDLKAARADARVIYEHLQRGEDPALSRQAAKLAAARERENTVAAVAKDWIKNYARKHHKRWQETESAMNRLVLPVLGERPIDSVTRRDAIALIESIAESTGPFMAHHIRGYLMKMYKWARARDIVEVNPWADTDAPISQKKSSRDRVLTDDEILAIWKKCCEIGYPFGDIVRMLLLTGQRRTEVAEMRWQDVDMDSRVWRLPRESTKADRSHDVPLSGPALDILRSVPRHGESDYVFTSTGGRVPFRGFVKPKRLLDERSGAKGWRIHDLRRTVGTNMAEHLGVPIHTISRVLNHAEGGVTYIYARASYMKEKRAALDKWARRLLTVVEEKAGEKVLSFRG